MANVAACSLPMSDAREGAEAVVMGVENEGDRRQAG
eukprot:CAMPEP_0183586286 /NCGR_PEP_ID=MMETSP0371-20130417/156935_1 /TAXON_ID=268820 /ORGANISM="Peridinium aciculiferum, Strain PAER-2" /LENGTH=35 /DNA_ID= /DNA_START= /DNA_END= /DNA_ORIENTATION=